MGESTCGYGRGGSRRSELYSWFETPLGGSLQAQAASRLRAVLPRLYGTVAVQLGGIGKMDLMDACVAPTRILLESLEQVPGTTVRGIPEELPFDSRSVDLVLMPHTLDFAEEPHHVLREAYRVLSPEGHAVIIGFNPFSLWGLRRILTIGARRAPWCGKFLRLARIKDWLSLLDFEFTQGYMVYYRPPVNKDSIRDRLFFMDKAGDRWWPLMGAVYIVVAKKRVPGVTPLILDWKKKPAVGPTAEPAARGAVTGSFRRGLRRFG